MAAKQVVLGTFRAVFIMLLVWMDRQLDFQKNVTISSLRLPVTSSSIGKLPIIGPKFALRAESEEKI